MAATIAQQPAPAHLLRSDMPVRMAKADLRKPESVDFRAAIGRCIERAYKSIGWNLDELAEAVHHDQRQVARWISGAERAQFDVLFSVESLRGPLVIALAGLSEQIEVVTEIRVRRPA
jgi:hypothetical protein